MHPPSIRRTLRRSLNVEENRDPAQAEIETETKFLEDNFGLAESTARATAEDRVLGVAPAESSYEVELERIAKAQALEKGPEGGADEA
jgi:hypothetical protein